MKLIDIFDHYPNIADQDMISEFWSKLEEHERMLLKK